MKFIFFKPLLYFIFWLICFTLAKGIFLAYHYDHTAALSAGEIARVIMYGWRLDASFAAYICVIPFFCFFLETLPRRPNLSRFVRGYTGAFLVFTALLTTADLELYRAWGYRLDATPLQYLNTPAEMVASVGTAPIFLLTGIFFLLILATGFIYLRFFAPYLAHRYPQPVTISGRGLALFLVIFLILPMRGGWQHIPVNQSDVYFSDKIYANHAAVNLPWNVVYSFTKKNYDAQNPYSYFPEAQVEKYVADLYTTSAPAATPVVLNTRRPNLLFIILESYTAKLVGCLGGEPGVTPNIDQIAREGILFTNIYASGDRSEKGLVALLSGYPVQTTTSIIKMPRKTERLPHLNQVLKAQGYRTSYYYGGELAFANIKSYLVNAGYEKLVSKYDFDPQTYNSKWGVHDHVLLNKWLKDFEQAPEPFFSTLFTLSSHEPYDIPIPAKFKGSDEATQFKNSVYYTDQAIGNFITAAKKQTWWPNTLILMAADHGHRFPGNDPNHDPAKFRIPFLLTGGALKQTARQVNTIGSQTDIVPTLLAQLNIPSGDFKWGQDLLSPVVKPFAFYVFNDGFGFVTPKGSVTFDNVSKQVISQDSSVTNQQLDYGKAYMQLSFGDYLRK